MKRSGIKIVYFAVFILIIFLGVRGIMRGSGASIETKEKIVVLDEPKALPENEDKLVMFSGQLSSEDKLEFKEFGINVETPILERKVEVYQYYDDYRINQIRKGWRSDDPEPTVTDKDKKVYYNIEKSIDDDIIYGKANLGDFEIDQEILRKINPNKFVDNLENYENYRVIDEKYLTNAKDDVFKIGDLRLSFKYLDIENAGEITLVGKQSLNKLVDYKLDTGKVLLEKYDGKITLDELVLRLDKEEQMSKYSLILGIIIMLPIGYLIFRSKSN